MTLFKSARNKTKINDFISGYNKQNISTETIYNQNCYTDTSVLLESTLLVKFIQRQTDRQPYLVN